MSATDQLLFQGADWDFPTLQRIYDACEEIALKELGLDVYPNQIEVITAEQMLDAYSSVGMPLYYKHWSFGKHFAFQEASYRKGLMGLAYEIVINSSPCISYLMEENTATMQTLVIAHAAFGHNHFFKNNYLFKQWTDADGILDYLEFAKSYVTHCEERHGRLAVEQTLDAAHALMSHGIDRYPGKKKLDLRAEEKRAGRRRAARGKRLQRSVADRSDRTGQERRAAERRAPPQAARPAAGKPAVFSRKDRAAAGALAARVAADRAAHRAVFLSAEPDQGHERGHRDLRSLSHHEPAAPAGTADPTAISSNSCSRTPTSCSSPSSTIRAIRASTRMRWDLR